jgi:hypothetical protein
MTKKKLLVISLMTALLSLSSVHVNAQTPSIIDLEVGYYNEICIFHTFSFVKLQKNINFAQNHARFWHSRSSI